MFFILLILKNLFINSTKQVFFFFLKQNLFFKIQSSNTFFIFSKNRKNCFPKQFFKNRNQTAPSFLGILKTPIIL